MNPVHYIGSNAIQGMQKMVDDRHDVRMQLYPK